MTNSKNSKVQKASVNSSPKTDVIKRLRYIEGHVRAVAKMIEDDAYCMDIINQGHAVIEAMKKVNQAILDGYLGECAYDAVNSKNAAKRKAAIDELVKLYTKK
ncbi:MAG: metal-sensitive transcriptional regulator [Candidatus Doudnabacteria bacterium]